MNRKFSTAKCLYYTCFILWWVHRTITMTKPQHNKYIEFLNSLRVIDLKIVLMINKLQNHKTDVNQTFNCQHSRLTNHLIKCIYLVIVILEIFLRVNTSALTMQFRIWLITINIVFFVELYFFLSLHERRNLT